MLIEPEDPRVCIRCQYGSVRACPRRQEAMRKGHISSDCCERKQALSWRNRPEKIEVSTRYDFSLRDCKRTLGVASYEKVVVYVKSIYTKNSPKTKFVRKLIQIEIHEILHSVLDKLGIEWWKREKRIKKGTDMLFTALTPYLDGYKRMWIDIVPTKGRRRHTR